MDDFFLEHIAPNFAYVIALSFAVGIVIAIVLGKLRSRLDPVKRLRFIMIETTISGLFLVALGVIFVWGVTS